ncbi:KDO2-lipid IV(A) lauroyltransferase [Lacibacter cauensis]|uniref:KDO2-lipid IV(A) lauroyltransferase n=1 Tax=Lacibacter cauensis TaxID=510947 RepID=A0A562SQE5_9BACT|nr:lipid A biosynthesis acyltransferase [Lacibacter cauensis]TWI83479.1 KDO2-lipid IV(A) lauroyltransferase [Lacibacter cauensis]
MYYILYGFLKLLSFIPLRLLYILSDFVYVLLFYVFGYRKKVVLYNLSIAFPEKTDKERKEIMKAFYHNFCDNFIEMIKLMSWSEKEINKRFKGNAEILNQWKDKGQSVQVVSGHFFNWEIANLGVASVSEIPFVVVYMPIKNKAADKLVYDIRKKTGSILIAATDFRAQFKEISKQQYALILVGDQNPGDPSKAYWLNFFSKPAPFVVGPEKGARRNNTVVIYADFYKVKRGYYEYKLELLTADPNSYQEGELTRSIVNKVEQSIRQRPANYLWSHRRWKHAWNEAYRDKWIAS